MMRSEPQPCPTAWGVDRPVLAGRRQIAGLWLPEAWYDEPTRRRLVLASWRPGSTLLRWPEGDLIRFAAPWMADCAALPGWPLQQLAGGLCSADADPPPPPPGQPQAELWLAVGAQWCGLRLADATPTDPSSWLDLSLGWVEMADCRLPPPAQVLVQPPTREVRELLGPAVPAAPSQQAQALLHALARQRRRDGAAGMDAPEAHGSGTRTGLGSDRGGGGRWGTAVGVLVVVCALVWGGGQGRSLVSVLSLAWLGAIVYLVWRLRQHGPFARPSAGSSAAGTASTGQAAARPSDGGAHRARAAWRTLPARAMGRVMPQRWRQWAARWAMGTGLASLLGAQHSAYLRRMLKMFDDGKLDEALRHAIPLGSGRDTLGQTLGRLAPRSGLSLGRPGAAATAIALGQDLEQHLRGLYRRSFEQLDRQGRIDEAVFVLAELLQARQEALDYLEQHGRHAQAAELALGWDMPAAQIVRLYALAGHWRFAVLVGRRDNAFDAAITLLEQRWPDAATQLRCEWASSLAERGRWLAAVQVVWRLESQRARAAEWLDIAESGGGVMAARALALRAQCLPASLAARGELIDALRDDPQLAPERAALARDILQLPAPIDPMARHLAALVAGALLADPPELDLQTLRQFVQVAADPALSADLPSAGWPGAVTMPLAQATDTARWLAPEAGTQAIADAVALPDGEFLLALGEAGAVRVDARGRWLARFAVPAQQLVIATDGASALALVRREQVWRVSRLDLARGQSQDLGMHRFDAFARCFDGVGWTVASGHRVQVLDTTRGLSEVLWQVADLPGPVVALDAGTEVETWLLRVGNDDNDHDLQQWRYTLPARRLRERDTLPRPQADQATRWLASDIGVIELVPLHPQGAAQTQTQAQGHTPVQAHTARAHPLCGSAPAWKDVPWHGPSALVAAAGAWLALAPAVPEEASEQTLDLVNLCTGRVHGRWVWPRGSRLKLRHALGVWVAFDDQGRVAAVSPATSGLRSLSLR